MSFSELSFAKKETGLSYDSDTLTLYGERRGYGITVTDENDEYILKIYADAPHKYEKSISEAINSLAEGLPKNAVNSQRCEPDFVELRLCRDFFLQEDLPELFETADSIISVLNGLCIPGAPARLPEKPAEGQAGKPRSFVPDFSLSSVKGLFGALIGAAAMIFIASALVKVNTEEAVGTLLSETVFYILPAVSTALIFFDYRFLARKLDAFGVFVCAIASVMCAVLSALLVSAKAYSAIAEITVGAAFSDLGGFYEASPEAASFCAKYLAVGVLVSVLSAIICCMWYYQRHPEEMILSEKARKSRKNNKR